MAATGKSTVTACTYSLLTQTMRYTKKLISTVAAVLFSHYCLACECPPFLGENWKADRVYQILGGSSFVFIGDVISHNDSTYTIKVLDVIKGEAETDTLTGYNHLSNSCSKYVTKGMWVIYTRLDDSGRIPVIDGCSISRSLSNPEFSFVPPLPGKHLDSLQLEELTETQKQEQLPLHLTSWMNEYAILAAYKNKSQVSEKGESSISVLTYVAIGLALIALLVALLKK